MYEVDVLDDKNRYNTLIKISVSGSKEERRQSLQELRDKIPGIEERLAELEEESDITAIVPESSLNEIPWNRFNYQCEPAGPYLPDHEGDANPLRSDMLVNYRGTPTHELENLVRSNPTGSAGAHIELKKRP